MSHRSRAVALSATVLATGIFATTSLAAPATGDVIATGGTIGVDLVDVSADGRYVLTENSYAQIPKTLLLVDRVTDESVPVLFDDAHTKALGTNTHYRGLDVSDDGNLILIGQYDAQYGQIDRLFTYDRTTQKNTTVGTLPSGAPVLKLASFARFIGGGTGVIYGGTDAAGKSTTYRRTSLTAPATAIADAIPASATRRGDVITWWRKLPAAVAPTGNRGLTWPKTRGMEEYDPSIATGYTVVGQPSKLVARTKIVETAGAPEPYCIDGGVTIVRTTPAIPLVDDYGQAVHVGPAKVFDERFPSGPHVDQVRLYDLSEDGQRTLTGVTSWQRGTTYLNITTAPGATGLPVLPELSQPDITTSGAKFFAHDTGIVRQESGPGTDLSGQVTAYGEIGAGTAPVAKTPDAVPGATDDSPTLQPDVTWDSCEAETKPPTKLAEFWSYVQINATKPATTAKSAGTVSVKLNASPAFRALPQVTIKVQTLGFTTWSRTVKTDQTVTLPKPYWLLPQTAVISGKVAADPATGAKAESVQYTFGWQAFR